MRQGKSLISLCAPGTVRRIFALVFLCLIAIVIVTRPARSDMLYEAQNALKVMGYYDGKLDGIFGPRSLRAFEQFCKDHNLPVDNGVDAYDVVKLSFLSRDGARVPMIYNHSFLPSDQPLTITNASLSYPACKDTYGFSRLQRPKEASYIISSNSYFFSPDIYESFPYWGGGDYDTKTIAFADSIFNMHHRCLAREENACEGIIEIVNHFEKSTAFTQNRDPNTDHPGAELHFQTIHRLLLPSLLAYSSAIQVLGFQSNHDAVGEWAYAAIIQNTYNPLARAQDRNKDFFRTDDADPFFDCPDIRAQNHSLQAAYLAGVYGAVWSDRHMFNLAFDALSITINSIREDGSLPCEAQRGANAIFYSGGTLSAMLQIIQLGELHGVDLNKIKNLYRVHDAAIFIINAAQDMSIINRYSKRDLFSWCDNDFRRQCIFVPFGRMVGFGWIPLYRKLFPGHENNLILDGLAGELKTSRDIERRRVLSAILKSAYPINQIGPGLYQEYSGYVETSTTVFEDSIEWNRGSPHCLYSVGIPSL
jgi:hypothetical protein